MIIEQIIAVIKNALVVIAVITEITILIAIVMTITLEKSHPQKTYIELK